MLTIRPCSQSGSLKAATATLSPSKPSRSASTRSTVARWPMHTSCARSATASRHSTARSRACRPTEKTVRPSRRYRKSRPSSVLPRPQRMQVRRPRDRAAQGARRHRERQHRTMAKEAQARPAPRTLSAKARASLLLSGTLADQSAATARLEILLAPRFSRLPHEGLCGPWFGTHRGFRR